MKKTALILAVIVIALCAFASCKKGDTADPTMPEDTSSVEMDPITEGGDAESEAPAVTTAAPAKLPAKFDEMTDNCVIAISKKWSKAQLKEKDLPQILAECYGDNALKTVGYNIIDIDGDGVAEFVLGTVPGAVGVPYERTIFAIYREGADGNAEKILESTSGVTYHYAGEGIFVKAEGGSYTALEYKNGELTATGATVGADSYLNFGLIPFVS